MLVLQLVFAVTMLSLIGEPLRILISSRMHLFRGLNLLQIYVLDLYLGGLFLFFLASVPFRLFDEIVIWLILGASVAFIILYHGVYVKAFKLNKGALYKFVLTRKYEVTVCTAVFVIFLLFLWVHILSIQNLVLGSIHDTSLHALLTTLILENNQIPETHQPYVSGAVIYPLGSHVLFAYLSMFLKLEPSKVILIATPFFNAMSVLGAYYLGKEIKGQEVGLIFAFVLAFVSMWPLYVAWGANPFVTGLPLFLVCLSLVPHLFSIAVRVGVKEIITAGILVGYLASLHLVLAEIVIATAVLWWLWARGFSFLRKLRSINRVLLFVGVSLIPISVFIFRFLYYFSYPSRNVGLPNDLLTYGKSPLSPPSGPPLVHALTHMQEVLLYNFNINPYQVLRCFWLGLATLGLGVPIFFILKKRDVGDVEKFTLFVFAGSLLLVLMALVHPFEEVIDHGKIWLIMYIAICFLVGMLTLRVRQRFFKIFIKNPIKKVMVLLLFFSIVYVPFICYRVVEDPYMLRGIYGLYSVTTDDDYRLMWWMRDNLRRNSIVLINPYEAGTFIPSVSNVKVIYPFTSHVTSGSYLYLVDLIRLGAFNETTYDLMKNFNLTHLFVGSPAPSQIWWEKPLRWDPLLFLGNPNFKLVENVGNSYLFQIIYGNENTVFQDDFEHMDWPETGWSFTELGSGTHNVSIVCNRDNRYLRLEAQKNQSISWFYSSSLCRKVYLWNASETRLSFYLNQTSVEPPNAVAISIVDNAQKRRIVFTTPSVFSEDNYAIELESNLTYFSYNLSREWEKKFVEPLPAVVIIELTVINIDSASATDALFDDVTLHYGFD